jgi:hypothetical protein
MAIGSAMTRLVLRLRAHAGAEADRQSMDPRALALHRRLGRIGRWVGAVSGNLDLLAALYGTDKFGKHEYTPVYRELMQGRRREPVRLLEIGVGGWEGELGGESLSMWSTYFPKGRIFAIDVYDKTSLSRGRVKVYQCSQTDGIRLAEIAREAGPFDFIIDDGSHANAHQIASFGILWPFVADGGVYIIEDVQTSYWPAYGGGPVETAGYAGSCVNYVKGLVDSVNLPEFLEPAAPRLKLDPTIGRISFHHNLIAITRDTALRRSSVDLGREDLRRNLMTRPAGGPPGP